MKVAEDNMGTMDASQARRFFREVTNELDLGYLAFHITTAGSVYIDGSIFIDKKDLHYPWYTKQLILHEIAHHLSPKDFSHGTAFHKQYAKLINTFLVGDLATG